MDRMEVMRMIDNRELENIYSLKHGTTAMIVLLREMYMLDKLI